MLRGYDPPGATPDTSYFLDEVFSAGVKELLISRRRHDLPWRKRDALQLVESKQNSLALFLAQEVTQQPDAPFMAILAVPSTHQSLQPSFEGA